MGTTKVNEFNEYVRECFSEAGADCLQIPNCVTRMKNQKL